MSGPIGEKFANKVISRVIEIRGDQTLEQLHEAIFQAYDRVTIITVRVSVRQTSVRSRRTQLPGSRSENQEERGRRRPHDEAGRPGSETRRVFGYWFDFGDDWFHQVQVDRIEKSIPTVTYPRLIKRVGKSPPQYPDE